jgi:hypothetical protein
MNDWERFSKSWRLQSALHFFKLASRARSPRGHLVNYFWVNIFYQNINFPVYKISQLFTMKSQMTPIQASFYSLKDHFYIIPPINTYIF